MGRRSQVEDLIARLREQFPAVEIVRTHRTPEHSQAETVEPKRSRRAKRLWADPEYVLKVKNGHARVNADPELRARRSQAAYQNWLDPDYRREQSEAHRGLKRSPESVAKTAAANRGRKNTEESLRRMRATWDTRSREQVRELARRNVEAMRGKPLSEAHKAKIRAKWQDPEYRRKQALSRGWLL